MIPKGQGVDFLITNEQLEQEIRKIERTSQAPVLAYSRSIKYCREILEIYRLKLKTWSFKSTSEEIKFFKEQKQIPLTQLIYYLDMRSLELEPSVSGKYRRKLLNKKIKEINDFFLKNREFQKYIELEQTFMDEFYFTRKSLNKMEAYDIPIYWDSDFDTTHDILLARLRAYQKLLPYLQRQLGTLTLSQGYQKTNCQWTSSKVALIELIYALYLSGSINHGTAELKTLASVFEELFNINLDNLYKNFSEIKARKGRRTRFLDELTHQLEQKLTHEEGL